MRADESGNTRKCASRNSWQRVKRRLVSKNQNAVRDQLYETLTATDATFTSLKGTSV